MADTLNITGSLYSSLKAKCEAAGTNFTVVCKKAGVNRSTVEKWKQAEPKTIRQVRALEAAIDEQSKLNGRC